MNIFRNFRFGILNIFILHDPALFFMSILVNFSLRTKIPLTSTSLHCEIGYESEDDQSEQDGIYIKANF